jgi:hypothetical protein
MRRACVGFPASCIGFCSKFKREGPLKGVFIPMFVSMFWIILEFISCGQLVRYKLLDVNDD